MNTRFLLMAQYNARAVIPVSDVCRDYFMHLTPPKLIAKIERGEIKLPLLRIEGGSQKATKGVHIADLADWIDARREAARKELEQVSK